MAKQRHYTEQELTQLMLLGKPGDNPEAYELLSQKLKRPALGLSAKWYKLTRIRRLEADGVIPPGTGDSSASCDCDASLLGIMERLDTLEAGLFVQLEASAAVATVLETIHIGLRLTNRRSIRSAKVINTLRQALANEAVEEPEEVTYER